MSNPLIPKQFQSYNSQDLYSESPNKDLIREVTLVQGDKTEFSEWDGYGVAYGFTNAREYSYTLRKLNERRAIGYFTNYYAQAGAFETDRVYAELVKNPKIHLYLTESNPWMVNKEYAEKNIKTQNPTLYKQLEEGRLLDKTYQQNKAVVDMINADSNAKRAFIVGNDNLSITSGENEFQQHAKVTSTLLDNNQRFVRIDTAAVSTFMGGWFGFNGFGAMGIGRTELFLQTNNPKLVKEVDQFLFDIEQNKKPLHRDNQYFFGSKDPLHTKILEDIKNSTGDIFIHGATLDLLGEDPISQALVEARKKGRNITVLSAGGRETKPTLQYLKDQGINVSITNKYIPGTGIEKNILVNTLTSLPGIKQALASASEHSNVVVIKGLGESKDTVTYLGSARLTGVFSHRKEGRPDTSVEGTVRLLASEVKGLDRFVIEKLSRRYKLSETRTSKYLFNRGMKRLYEPEFIVNDSKYPIKTYHLPYIQSKSKDATKRFTYSSQPNYSIRLPSEHFLSYEPQDRLPIISTFQMLYESRVPIPQSVEGYQQYNEDLEYLKDFDRRISTPNIGQYINWKVGRNIYTEGYGLGGSLFSYIGRQLDNLFGFDDMLAERDEIKRKKVIRPRQFIALHDKLPQEQEIGQFETILNTAYQTASGVAIALGTYTSINLPVQHIRAKFEDVFTEQFFAPGKPAWYRTGAINTLFFGGTLGMTVTDATTKVWSSETKTWAVDADGKYIAPTARQQVAYNLVRAQSEIIAAKRRLEDNLIQAAINKGLADGGQLDHKSRLINALEYLDDSEFNEVKGQTIVDISREKEEYVKKKAAENNIKLKDSQIRRITSYLDAMTATSRDQLLEGRVVIGSTSEFLSIYGVATAFRKFDTTRFDLLLAPILRNINPYEFSANPDSAFGVYNASVEEFRRTLSQGIHIVYDAEAKGAKSSVRLANTGVQRNMELAKSLDRIGHLLPVNLFYWMPSVRKALRLPQFDNRENIVWADVFSIEQKTKQVEATLDYLGRATGIRWHKIGPETPEGFFKLIGFRLAEGVKSLLMPIPTTAQTILRSVELLARQRIVDQSYKVLETEVLKPLYQSYNEKISKSINNFNTRLGDLNKALSQMDELDPSKSPTVEIKDADGNTKTVDLEKYRRLELVKQKGELIRSLIQELESGLLGSPAESEVSRTKGTTTYNTVEKFYTLNDFEKSDLDPKIKEKIRDYQTKRAALERTGKQLLPIGFVEPQEVVNPLDKKANAGKRNLSLPHEPTPSKTEKLRMFRGTLKIAGTLLLTDAAVDFAFLNSGVSIFSQIKARRILSLQDLHLADGVSKEELDHPSRGLASFRFENTPGMSLTLGSAATLGVLGGILFPTNDTPPARYKFDGGYKTVEDELSDIKKIIDHLEKEVNGELNKLPIETQEAQKAYFGKDIPKQKDAVIDIWKATDEVDIDTQAKFDAIEGRLNTAISQANSIEMKRLNYRFNKKTAWGGFILGLLGAKLAGGAIVNFYEWKYNDEPTMTKVFKLLTGNLNSRPDMDSVSSVLSSYMERAAGELYDNKTTVEDLAVAAALEYKAYSSIKVTERKNMVYNMATQATLPFFQLAMIGRISNNERKVTLGTAFQLNATLGLGISPILPVAIRLGEPPKTKEQHIEANEFKKYQLGKGFNEINLTAEDVEQIKQQGVINLLTAGSQFVYEKDSNFEAAITFLGTARLLGQVSKGIGYAYERSTIRRNLKVDTAVNSFTQWTDSMPVASARALIHGTVKHLINLPVFFMDSSIRAIRRSRAATTLTLGASAYFLGSSFMRDFHDRGFRQKYGLTDEDQIPEDLRDHYERGQAFHELSSFILAAGTGFFIKPTEGGSQVARPISSNRRMFNRLSRSAGTLALATYTGFFISRLISDPSTSFKGYSTGTDRQSFEATVGIGTVLTAGFLAGGVFTSEESLLESYKARLQAEPDYKAKLQYELKKVVGEHIINSDYGEDVINNLVQDYESAGKQSFGVRVKRMLMTTDTMTEMVGARLFEQGQGDGLRVVASSRYNLLSARLGQAYAIYALTRLAALGIVSTASAQQRDSLYQLPFIGESIKVLSGVGGFDVEDTFKYNYQPSITKTFIPELVKILTFNILNLEPYQDKSDPFFNLVGSFGLSFKQSGISSYFQLASTSSDLSISSFNIAQDYLGEMDAFKDIVHAKGFPPKKLYNIMRGRKARTTPMGFVPISEDTQNALGGSLGLSTALDIRLLKQANISFQRPDEIAQDLYLEGLLTGRISHGMFKDFKDNKLPKRINSLDHLKGGKFFLGEPGSELMVDENGDIVVRKESRLIYRPEFLENLFKAEGFEDRLVYQSGGFGSFFSSTFTGLSQAIGDTPLGKIGLGIVAPGLTMVSLGVAAWQSVSTALYLGRRRQTLELFEETYMSRATVSGQASRYQFKVVKYGEHNLLAQIDLATGREGKVFGLAYFDELYNQTIDKVDKNTFQNSLVKQLNTTHTKLIKDLNVFFNTDINKQVQSLLEEVNQHYLSDKKGELKIIDLDRKKQLAESLQKTLLEKLRPILSANIKSTNITVGHLLYGMEDSDVDKFLLNLIDNPNNSLTKSLANNLVDTINQYSKIAKDNPELLQIITNNLTKGQSGTLTMTLDMLRAAQGVNRVVDPHVNHYAGQLIYQLTEPRLNQFDLEDPQIKKEMQAGMTEFERQQAKLKQEARALAESQGMYGKKVWGETALSDIGNYGFRLVGDTINNYLQYVQPIYETVEGASIGLDASKSRQERERGYTWASKYFAYNATSLAISFGITKFGVPGLAAFFIGGALQVGLMSMLQRDPTYAQREHNFFRKIGDKLVPDDGSKGFHLTPIVKPINTITGEVTGPLLAEIHGKEKPHWATFVTNFLLPQTQYIEEWDMKQNAKRKAIEQFKKTITIKGSPTAEYIHPELMGRPIGLIQEVRYHRYFKTNAFGGRVLSDFSLGAYRPSGLMMLALSRRQAMSDYYIGRSMVTNILGEAGRPPDDEGFKELGASIGKLAAGLIGGSLLLKYTGLGYLGAGIADWMIGGLSGKLANYMFGPKYEASRQARFIMDDATALLGIDKNNVPIIEYGGPQATSTYYEDGKIILSHADAVSLASRRTGSPDTVDDARIKHIITHELIHHQQVDPKTRQFTVDSPLNKKENDLEPEDLDPNRTSIEPNQPRRFVDMTGGEIWDFLEKVKAGDESVKGTTITKEVASNILNLTTRSTNLAVETAEAQGIVLDKSTVELIRNNEVQAHFLSYQVIEESNALINPVPPSSDLDAASPLESPLDSLRDGTAMDSGYRGLSSPDYIVKGGGFVSQDHYDTRETLISPGLEETLREGAEVDPDNPTSFNRRYAGTDNNSGFRQLPDGTKVFPMDEFRQLNWGIVETTIEKGWFRPKRRTRAGENIGLVLDLSPNKDMWAEFKGLLRKADPLYTHQKENVQGNIKKDAFYVTDEGKSLLIVRHSIEEQSIEISNSRPKVVDKYYVIPLHHIDTAQDQGGVLKARAVYENIFEPWIEEQMPSNNDYWKGNMEATVRNPSFVGKNYLTPSELGKREKSTLPTTNTEVSNKTQTPSPSEMPSSNQFKEYETKLTQLTQELNDLKVLSNQVQGVQIMSLKDSIVKLNTSVYHISHEVYQNDTSGELSTKFINLYQETDKLLVTTTKAELTFLTDNIDVTNAEQLETLNKYITTAKSTYSQLFYTSNNELTEFGRRMEQAQIKINQALNPPKSNSPNTPKASDLDTSESPSKPSNKDRLSEIRKEFNELTKRKEELNKEFITADEARRAEIKAEFEPLKAQHAKLVAEYNTLDNKPNQLNNQQQSSTSEPLKPEPKIYTPEELVSKLKSAQGKKFDAVNILWDLNLTDTIVKVTNTSENRTLLVTYAEQINKYNDINQKITLYESNLADQKNANTQSAIKQQLEDAKKELSTVKQDLEASNQEIKKQLGLDVVNNIWDTETVEVGKGQIEALDLRNLGMSVKSADEAIIETQQLIEEHLKTNPLTDDLQGYTEKLKWEDTKPTNVHRPEPIVNNQTASLDSTNYLKNFVKRASKAVNATNNVEGLKLSLSPIELISETGRYLVRVSNAIHTKDADMNVGKTLVLGLGAFDLITTHFNKTHTQTQLGKIAVNLKAGKISKEDAKLYLASLRQAERSSNLATGTSLGISLFSNSFLFNLIPSLVVGSVGNKPKATFEEYDSQIKQLVEADLDRLLNRRINIAREGEAEEYYYGSIASDQTFSLSSTAKSYRENKVLTNLIDQNDIIQKGIAKKIKLDKIFGGIIWAGDKVLSQRTGRLGIGAAGVLGFNKLISNERDRFYAEWEQLDPFKKSQYGEFDRFYQQHRSKFLIGGQWLSGLTVAVETINVAWDVGSYGVAWGAHHLANILGHITDRKATVKGGRIHNEVRLQEAIESIDKQSEIAKKKLAKAEQSAKTGAQSTILPESNLSTKLEIELVDGKPQAIIETDLTLPQADDLSKVGDIVPEKLPGQEALDNTLGGRLRSAWKGLFTNHTKDDIPKRTPKVKAPKAVDPNSWSYKTGQWFKTKFNNTGTWLANTKYNIRKGLSDFQHSINSSAPVKGTADWFRGVKVKGNEKFFTPLGQGFKRVINAISSKSGQLFNLSFPQLDNYLAHTGVRGAAINAIGPSLDVLFYLTASHEIKHFDKSTTPDFMFATTYREAGRSGGSLAGSIMGMRSSGFVADILFSFAYAEDFANRMEVLGLRRYKYHDYYKGREGLLGSSLLQTELNLLTIQESRTGARSGNAMNAGLGLVLDMYRRKDEYEVYQGKKYYIDPIEDAVDGIKTPGKTIDDVLHTAKQADPKVSRRVYKLKKLGIAGIVAKVDKEKEAVLTRALGADRLKAMQEARDLRINNFGESLSVYRGFKLQDGAKVTVLASKAEKGKAFVDILKTSARVATVGDGAFKGFLGSSLLGTVIDTGMIFASGHLHNQAVDIMEKHKYSGTSVEAAFELFESSQRMKSSSVFSLLGTFTGTLAGSTFGLKGAEVGSAIGGVTGGTFGDKIGQRSVQVARDNNFTDFEAIGKGQNIGLGTGLAIGAGFITLAALGIVTAPLWLLAAGVFALGAVGYTFGGHLPVFSEDGITAEGIGEAAKETAITLGQSAWYVGDQGVRNTGKFLRWGGRTIKSGAKATMSVGKTIGKNLVQGAKDMTKNTFKGASNGLSGRNLASQEALKQRRNREQAQSVNRQQATAKDNRNWLDKWLFPAAQANELEDYLAQKQAANQVTTIKQYLGQKDPYHSPTNSELLEAEENTPEARRRKSLFEEFMMFKEESEGFFKWLTDSKWFKGLARITAFIFSPVQMFYRFGRDFLKNPGEAISTLWDRTTRTLNDWKNKIGNFWNKAMNKLFGGEGEYHDPYAEERAHQHKFLGRILKGIGIDYNAVPDVSNITTVGQLFKAFGAAMGWKSEADAEAAARMGLSEFGSNAITVATVFASTRNRQIAIESGNPNLAVTPAASVSWSTIIASPGQYQVYSDGSMQRVQLTPSNIQKVAQAAAIVSSGQLVNKLMAGEGIDRPLTKQEAENIANSVAFSIPTALDKQTWHTGHVTITAKGSDGSHTYAHSDNTRMNYIQLGQTKYPRFSTGSGGNQKPKGFNATEIMGALYENFVFYAETYNGPTFLGGGFNLNGYKLINHSQGTVVTKFEDLGPHWNSGYTVRVPDASMKYGVRTITNKSGQLVYDLALTDASGNRSVPIPSIVSGEVISVGGSENWVIIRDDNGVEHSMMHFETIHVKRGQRIEFGQIVGIQGAVGKRTVGIHVHIQTTEAVLRRYILALNGQLPATTKSNDGRLVRPFTADEESIIRRQFDSRRAPGFIKEAEARGYKKQAMATNLVNTKFKDPKTGKTIQLQEEAYLAFQQMQQAALADGINLGILSGYRSLQQQADLLKANANKTNAEILNTQAPVGYSKHSTGLAVDIGTMEKGLVKENTPEYNWLVNNAARFGYQISYPKGNKQGPAFEAWEWSYVGGNQSAAAPDSGKLVNLTDTQIKNIKAVLKPGMAFTPAIIQDIVYAMQGGGRSKEEIDHFLQGAANYNANLAPEEKKRLEGIINGTIKDPYADFKLDRSLKDIPNVSYPTTSSSSSSSSSPTSSTSAVTANKPTEKNQFVGLSSKPPSGFEKEFQAFQNEKDPTKAIQMGQGLLTKYKNRADIVQLINLNMTGRYLELSGQMTSSLPNQSKPNQSKPNQQNNRTLTQVQFDNRIKDQMGRFTRTGNINYLEQAIKITEQYIKNNPQDSKAKEQLQKLRSIHNNTPKPGPLRKLLNILGQKDKENVVASYSRAISKSNIANNGKLAIHQYNEAQLKQVALATDEEIEELVVNQQKEAELIKEIRVVTQEVAKAKETLRKQAATAYKIEGASNVKEPPVDNSQLQIAQKPKQATVKTEQTGSNKSIRIEISQPGQYVLDNYNLLTNAAPPSEYSLLDNSA